MSNYTWTDTEILDALIAHGDIGAIYNTSNGWYYDGVRYPDARSALEVLTNRIKNRQFAIAHGSRDRRIKDRELDREIL